MQNYNVRDIMTLFSFNIEFTTESTGCPDGCERDSCGREIKCLFIFQPKALWLDGDEEWRFYT